MASTTDVGSQSEQVTTVIDRLKAVSHITGNGLPKIFIDWVDVTVASLEGDDRAYEATLKRLIPDHCTEERRQEVAIQLARGFGDLVVETSKLQRPVVGDVYEGMPSEQIQAVSGNISRLGRSVS